MRVPIGERVYSFVALHLEIVECGVLKEITRRLHCDRTEDRARFRKNRKDKRKEKGIKGEIR